MENNELNINNNVNENWTLYWLDGTKNIIKGESIEVAFRKAGYGLESLKALDLYMPGDDNSYERKDGNWVKVILKKKRIYLVWNNDKTEGFFTTDPVLAHEVRKGAETKCYNNEGDQSKLAVAFCNIHGHLDCELQEVEVDDLTIM